MLMKRFTLFFAMVMIAVASWSQKPLKSSASMLSPNLKTLITQKTTQQERALQAAMKMRMPVNNARAKAPGAIDLGEGLVIPPPGVEGEDWNVEGVWYYYNNGWKQINVDDVTKVAIVGNDIYIQGLAIYFEDAWIQGTIDAAAGTATFPTGQFVGEDEYGKEYLVGSVDGENLCDIVFAYEAESKTLTVQTYIIENSEKNKMSLFAYWAGLTISAGAPEAVEVPSSLTTNTYSFQAYRILMSEGTEGAEDEGDILFFPYKYQVQVGFSGKDVYFNGFSVDTSEMWAKGTLSDDGTTVTIPANQYMGIVKGYSQNYKYFITGVDEEGNMTDLVFQYDAEKGTFVTEQFMALNSSSSELNPYLWLISVSMLKLEDFAATPATPKWMQSLDIYVGQNGEYYYIAFDIPDYDTEDHELIDSKLYYTLWIEKNGKAEPLTLTADLYNYDFDEDVVEIPFVHDGYDVYYGGEMVFLNFTVEEMKTWKKIGIQSVYYGGNERKESSIVWSDLPADLTTGIANVGKAQGEAVCFDLMGRQINGQAKGLVIKQVRQSDGSVKTMKVLRK